MASDDILKAIVKAGTDEAARRLVEHVKGVPCPTHGNFPTNVTFEKGEAQSLELHPGSVKCDHCCPEHDAAIGEAIRRFGK